MTTTEKGAIESFLKIVIHKKGVKVKQAAEVGRKMVTVFRGKDFVEFITENSVLFQRKCPEALASVGWKEGEEISADHAEKLGDALIDHGFVARSVAKVLKVAPKEDSPSGTSAPKKKKWPEKVVRLGSDDQFFETAGSFYIVLYEGSKTVQHIFSGLAIVLVLLLCMFPAWPAWAKIAVWYVVFWLSTAMILILIVRMILYVCFWTVGMDFWLFPNILDEYAGVIDSFKPLYSVERRRDGYAMTIIRLVAMVVIGLASYEFAQHNSWEDIKNFARNSINDILEWGTDKLTALPQPKQQYLSLADIERMTDDNSTQIPTTIPQETVQAVEEEFFDEMQEF
jgi:translocation protein SEC62